MNREQAHEAAKRKVFIVDDNGNIVRPKTQAERWEEDKAEALIAARAKAAADEANARKQKTPGEKYLEYAESLHTFYPGDSRRKKLAIEAANRMLADEAEQAAIENRQRQIQSDPNLKLVREHSEAFSRTPPPFADSEAVHLAVALANSTEFDDPENQAKEYWQRVRLIESDALVRQRDETSRLDTEANKANALAARSKATEIESQIRVEAVDSRLNPA